MNPEIFDQVAGESLAAFDALGESTMARRGVNLACREGCSLCCWLRVDVFAHEVFVIARHIRRHFSPEELTALLVRLSAHAESVNPLTPFEHATRNVPCPLLQEGRCTVYAARPRSCRRHHSQDFAACQFTFDHPTDLTSPAAHDRPLFETLTLAMQQDIETHAERGFDYTIYELGTALHEALNDPEGWERWCRRERAFNQASVTPAE